MSTTYKYHELKEFSSRVLEELDLKKEEAEIVGEALIRANLEGINSHGISRLSIYAKRLMEKRISPTPNISFRVKGESVLLVDGDNGLGQVVAAKAVDEGMKIARTTGVASIAVRNSNHFGGASYYCQRAVEQGFGIMAFTNSPPGISPWGGTKAFFGTNPIALGFPNGTDCPVIIDMSTSVVARGKIILAAKENRSIPKGWAIDENGNDTEVAQDALKGAVLPVGGVKGYALALAVEILTGILSGAAYGPHVNNIYNEENSRNANVGHFFVLFDIEKFMPLERFNLLMKGFLEEIKSNPLKSGVDEILYPGERRHRERTMRMKEGIILSKEVIEELIKIGEQVGVKFPNKVVTK